MGQVYLAQQANSGRPVVVKVMHKHLAEDAHRREAFRREIERRRFLRGVDGRLTRENP
jgi:serine/threonine protein kinase